MARNSVFHSFLPRPPSPPLLSNFCCCAIFNFCNGFSSPMPVISYYNNNNNKRSCLCNVVPIAAVSFIHSLIHSFIHGLIHWLREAATIKPSSQTSYAPEIHLVTSATQHLVSVTIKKPSAGTADHLTVNCN